jgi:hypothetical protein
MGWKTVGVITAVLLTTPHASAAETEGAARALTVRTYNNFGVAPEDLQVARTEADAILRDAGIEIVWLDCWFRRSEPANASPVCRQPLQPTDIVLRFQAGNASPSDKLVSMGFSLIGNGSERPYLSTVFPDVVQSVARGAAVDARRVLGLAIAHEIGHLMLNTNSHADAGLMRAGWSRNELRRNVQADWRFLENENAVIRAAVAAR